MNKLDVKEHIDRCVELYAGTIDVIFEEPIDRPHFEQMLADLLLAKGMLMALAARSASGQ